MSDYSTNVSRLYEGKSPIREMTDEEVEFNRLNVALHACSDSDCISEGLRSPGVADTTPYFTVCCALARLCGDVP